MKCQTMFDHFNHNIVNWGVSTTPLQQPQMHKERSNSSVPERLDASPEELREERPEEECSPEEPLREGLGQPAEVEVPAEADASAEEPAEKPPALPPQPQHPQETGTDVMSSFLSKSSQNQAAAEPS